MKSNLKRTRQDNGGQVIYRRCKEKDVAKNEALPQEESFLKKKIVSLPARKREVINRFQDNFEITDVDDCCITIQLKGKHLHPKLPTGYYFKGGVARETLRKMIAPESSDLQLRDYDLVRFAAASDQHDHELAMRFMKNDYRFGRGVEVVESKEMYFNTRDLTINEVLYHNMSLEFSYQAVWDLKKRVLRPTQYILSKSDHNTGISLTKALRFQAEALIKGIDLSLADFPEEAEALPFYIALNLKRALGVNPATANEYLFSIWKHKLFMTDILVPPSLTDAVIKLAPEVSRGVNFFSNLPPEVFEELHKR